LNIDATLELLGGAIGVVLGSLLPPSLGLGESRVVLHGALELEVMDITLRSLVWVHNDILGQLPPSEALAVLGDAHVIEAPFYLVVFV